MPYVLGPESSKAVAEPDVEWWICKCGRHSDRHSHRSIPNTGGKEIVCRDNPSGRFEPADERYEFTYDGLKKKA